MIKKSLSILLTLVLILSMFSACIVSAKALNIEDRLSTTSFTMPGNTCECEGYQELWDYVLSNNLWQLPSHTFVQMNDQGKEEFTYTIWYIIKDGAAIIVNCNYIVFLNPSPRYERWDIPSQIDGCPVKYIFGLLNDNQERYVLPKKVIIPDTVEYLGRLTFFTSDFGEIQLPASLKCIDHGAFAFGTNLTTLDLPDGLEEIGPEAFTYSSLQEIEIPESVCRIGREAFACCRDLSFVTIHPGVTYIGEDAFKDSNNVSVVGEPGSYAEDYARQNSIPFIPLKQGDAQLRVFGSDGKELSSGFTVNWYEKGTDQLIGTGAVAYGFEDNKEYQYEIILGDDLRCRYRQPSKQDVPSGDESSDIKVMLDAYETRNCTGSIINSEGNPITDATILMTQYYDSEFSNTIMLKSDASGKFSSEIIDVPTDAVISAAGYFSRTIAFNKDDTSEQDIVIDNIALSELPKNKISLNLSVVCAALPGAEAEVKRISSTDGLNISLFNQTKNRAVEGFIIQKSSIILQDDEAFTGDVYRIEVGAEDESMFAKPVTFKLDSQKSASCDITLTENGRFMLNSVSDHPATILMLFDEDGEYVLTDDAVTGYISKPLAQGAYTAVFIQKNDLLRSVPELARLKDYGLEEKTHYTQRSVNIQPGIIANVNGISVPPIDEEELYYTVPDKTSTTCSYSTAMIGKYVVIRCSYEINEKNTSENEKVTIEIPDNVEFAERSVTLDGKAKTYTKTDNSLTVITNQRKGIVRLYVVAVDKGENRIGAYLSFENSFGKVLQPLGTVSFTSETGDFRVPEKSNQKTVAISGRTMPKSQITVFDNNKAVGDTVSSKNGSWELRFDLIKSASEYHEVYIQIDNEHLNKPVISDSRFIVYNEDLAVPEKITIINTAHPADSLNAVEYRTEINYLLPGNKTLSYRYWPAFPLFTFIVKFNGNTANLSNVSIVTIDSNGTKSTIPAEYDIATDSWIASQRFENSHEAPQYVTVSYTDASSLTKSMTRDYLSELVVRNMHKDNNVINFEMVNGDDVFSIAIYPKDEKLNAVPGRSEDYIIIESRGDYLVSYNEKEEITVVAFDNQYLISKKKANSVQADTTQNSKSGNTIDLSPTGITINRNTLNLQKNTYEQIVGRVMKMLDDLENGKCEFDDESGMTAHHWKRELRNRRILTTAMAGRSIYNTYNTLSGVESEHPFLSLVTSLADVPNVIDPYNDVVDQVNQDMNDVLQKYYQLKENYGCDPGDDLSEEAEGESVDLIEDPSGYVYEAVPSNRLEGVKAEAYYYDYALDAFGVPEEEKSDILWDAENYDQVNPLYTDAYGMYAWDVPMGRWLVKFSKDGYYDTDSRLLNMVDEDGYLPVPPPQTEVNVGMVSKAAPSVEEISAYNNEIRIVFSQYMKLDSVSDKTVTVKMNGKAVEGTVTPLNAEYDYDNINRYASKFAFIPKASVSGNISITVDGAINYAGTKMEKAYTQTCRVNVKPESINAESEISVTYRSGALLEVDILPKEAAAGMKVNAVSSSPSIVNVVNGSAITDANGHANIMLEGKLPGQGEITITVGGTDLVKTVTTNVTGVEPVNGRCEKVTANIASGSTVDAGVVLELSTTTEGAEIYYTLDGTCPCSVDSPSRIKYTEPIVIDENTFIIAYAVKDGMQESYTAGFNYYVPAPVVDVLLGDVDEDGTVTIIDATYIQRHLANISIPFDFNDAIADTDLDGSISIIDATYIQRWLANLPSNDKIGKSIR